MRRIWRKTLIFFSIVMNILHFLETLYIQAASGLEFTAGSKQHIKKKQEKIKSQIIPPKTHTVWFEGEMSTFIVTANT